MLMGVYSVLGQLNHPLTNIISNHVAQFPLSRAFEMVLKSPFGSSQETVKTTLGTEWKSYSLSLSRSLPVGSSEFGKFPVRFCLPSFHSADLVPVLQ